MSTDPFPEAPRNDLALGAEREPAQDEAPGFQHIPFEAYRPQTVESPASDLEPQYPEAKSRPASDLPLLPTSEGTATSGRLETQGRHETGRPKKPSYAQFATDQPVTIAIADDTDYSLDPRSVHLARLGGLIGTAILSGLALIPAIAAVFSAPDRWPIVIGMWSFIALLLVSRTWFWPRLSYRHTSYRLSPRGLVIRRGVLWRSVAHVPRSRVQHTDVSQGPLERYFELGTLTVHTAGTQFASVSLGGLAHGHAEQIRDVLIDAGEGDGV